MKKILITMLLTLSLSVGFLSLAEQVSAQACPPPNEDFTCRNGCTKVGDCRSGKTCIKLDSMDVILNTGDPCGAGQGQSIVGNVSIPRSILRLNSEGTESATVENIGLLAWINRLLILFFSICVVWFMVQLVLTGTKIVASPGDAKAMEELKEALTYPIIGMIILASSFLIATLIGVFFFNNSEFITNPELPTARDFTP